MRYRELLEGFNDEGFDDDKLYFHVTTDRRLRSILNSGIEPGHHRRWTGLDKRRYGDRGYIYLISDFTSAVKFAAKMQWELGNGKRNVPISIVCLRPEAELEPDPNPENLLNYGGTWFQMQAMVPASNIVRSISLTPDLTEQVMNGEPAVMPPLVAEPA